MQLHKARLCTHDREHVPLLCSDSHPRTPLKPSRGCEGSRWSKKDVLYSHALRRGLRHLISVLRSPSPKLKEWGHWHKMPIIAAWLGQAWDSEHQQSLLNVVGDAGTAGPRPGPYLTRWSCWWCWPECWPRAPPEYSLQGAGLAFPAAHAALWGGGQPRLVLPLLK